MECCFLNLVKDVWKSFVGFVSVGVQYVPVVLL